MAAFSSASIRGAPKYLAFSSPISLSMWQRHAGKGSTRFKPNTTDFFQFSKRPDRRQKNRNSLMNAFKDCSQACEKAKVSSASKESLCSFPSPSLMPLIRLLRRMRHAKKSVRSTKRRGAKGHPWRTNCCVMSPFTITLAPASSQRMDTQHQKLLPNPYC